MRWLVLLVLFCSTAHSNSRDDVILFGPEFTFWVPEPDDPELLEEVNFGFIEDSDVPEESREESPEDNGLFGPHVALAANQVVRRMRDHLVYGQEPEARFAHKLFTMVSDEIDRVTPEHLRIYGQGHFDSPNGWSILLKQDPGVLEATMNPMQVATYRHFSGDMQDALFVSAANEGYFPSLYGGGGHINIDLSYFKKRPLLLRNFIVDLLNHNELFMGIFGFDTHNAISTAMVPTSTWKKLVLALQVLDHLKPNYQLKDVSNFVIEISEVLGESKDPYMDFWRRNDLDLNHSEVIGKERSKKYNSFRVEIDNRGTEERPKLRLGDRMELRGVRAQASMDVWVRQTQLLEARIKYLESLVYPIELEPRFTVDRLDEKEQLEEDFMEYFALEVPIDPQEALQAFHEYVTEAGENWEDHQDYIWPQWITSGELEEFNRKLDCAQYFQQEAS